MKIEGVILRTICLLNLKSKDIMDQAPASSSSSSSSSSIPSTISFGLSASLTNGVLSISGYVSAGRCTCILTPSSAASNPGGLASTENSQRAPFSARIFFGGQDETDATEANQSAAADTKTMPDEILDAPTITANASSARSFAVTESYPPILSPPILRPHKPVDDDIIDKGKYSHSTEPTEKIKQSKGNVNEATAANPAPNAEKLPGSDERSSREQDSDAESETPTIGYAEDDLSDVEDKTEKVDGLKSSKGDPITSDKNNTSTKPHHLEKLNKHADSDKSISGSSSKTDVNDAVDAGNKVDGFNLSNPNGSHREMPKSSEEKTHASNSADQAPVSEAIAMDWFDDVMDTGGSNDESRANDDSANSITEAADFEDIDFQADASPFDKLPAKVVNVPVIEKTDKESRTTDTSSKIMESDQNTDHVDKKKSIENCSSDNSIVVPETPERPKSDHPEGVDSHVVEEKSKVSVTDEQNTSDKPDTNDKLVTGEKQDNNDKQGTGKKLDTDEKQSNVDKKNTGKSKKKNVKGSKSKRGTSKKVVTSQKMEPDPPLPVEEEILPEENSNVHRENKEIPATIPTVNHYTAKPRESSTGVKRKRIFIGPLSKKMLRYPQLFPQPMIILQSNPQFCDKVKEEDIQHPISNSHTLYSLPSTPGSDFNISQYQFGDLYSKIKERRRSCSKSYSEEVKPDEDLVKSPSRTAYVQRKCRNRENFMEIDTNLNLYADTNGSLSHLDTIEGVNDRSLLETKQEQIDSGSPRSGSRSVTPKPSSLPGGASNSNSTGKLREKSKKAEWYFQTSPSNNVSAAGQQVCSRFKEAISKINETENETNSKSLGLKIKSPRSTRCRSNLPSPDVCSPTSPIPNNIVTKSASYKKDRHIFTSNDSDDVTSRSSPASWLENESSSDVPSPSVASPRTGVEDFTNIPFLGTGDLYSKIKDRRTKKDTTDSDPGRSESDTPPPKSPKPKKRRGRPPSRHRCRGNAEQTCKICKKELKNHNSLLRHMETHKMNLT